MRCRLSPVFQLPIFGNFRDFGNLFLRPSACVLQPSPTPTPLCPPNSTQGHPIPGPPTRAVFAWWGGRHPRIGRGSRLSDHAITCDLPITRFFLPLSPRSQIGVGFSDCFLLAWGSEAFIRVPSCLKAFGVWSG